MMKKVLQVATMNVRKEKSSRYPDRPNVSNVNRDHTVTVKAPVLANCVHAVTSITRKVLQIATTRVRKEKSSPKKARPNVTNANQEHTVNMPARPAIAHRVNAVTTVGGKVLLKHACRVGSGESSRYLDRPDVPNANRDHTVTYMARANARSALAVTSMTRKVLYYALPVKQENNSQK